jgi:hypothetical protein
MGGIGSTRWAWHRKKIQVEQCLKLKISDLKPNLRVGAKASITWMEKDNMVANIGIHIKGSIYPEVIWLRYYLIKEGREREKVGYPVYLQTTPLPWGGHRYWFSCPMTPQGKGCGRRVAYLYLPLGYSYFSCRHCYDLTYKSSQEAHMFDHLHKMVAVSMRNLHPFMTYKDIAYILGERKRQPFGFADRRYRDHMYRESKYQIEQYKNYLNSNELYKKTGLNDEKLTLLENARLLVPDTKDGRYRPKLVGWAKKLNYLLEKIGR